MSRQRFPAIVKREAMAFLALLAILALDEYLDLPAKLFGAPETPLRHHEFLMESGSVLVIALVVIGLTWFAERRLRQLNSLLVMCAWCRQVRVDNRWVTLEGFLSEHTATTTKQGLCPDCYATAESTRAAATTAR